MENFLLVKKVLEIIDINNVEQIMEWVYRIKILMVRTGVLAVVEDLHGDQTIIMGVIMMIALEEFIKIVLPQQIQQEIMKKFE